MAMSAKDLAEFKAIAAKTPKLVDFTSFSKIVVGLADQDPDVVAMYGHPRRGEDGNALTRLFRKNKYQKAIEIWQKTVAPGGLPLTRGLHGLVIPDRWSAHAYYRATRRDKNFFSLNAAYVGADFSAPVMPRDLNRLLRGKKHAELRLSYKNFTKDTSGWVQHAMAKAAKEALDDQGVHVNGDTLNRAAMAMQSTMLIAYRAKPGYAFSFGGDSESGFMTEAEMYVKRCDPCLEGVFVMSPDEIDAPLATLAERKRFCLSWWNAVIYEPNDPMSWSKRHHIYIAANTEPPKTTKRVIEIREPADHVYRFFPDNIWRDAWKQLGKPMPRMEGFMSITKDWRWYRVA